MSRFRYGPRLAVFLTGLTLLVSACGGDIQSTSGAAAPALDSEQGVYASQAPANEAPAPQTGDASAASGADKVKVIPQNRAIIYTAEMRIKARDVTAAADSARRIVTGVGGYLAMEKSDAYSGGEDSAMLVFKIPPGNYPGTLDRLGRELGTRESLQQNTEDVTEEVADVESRLKSAKAALDSLRTLLKKANTIGEVLKVEREVSNRESELESLQARQKTLASQTSMATLTLNLIGPAKVIKKKEKKKEEPAGFLGGLKAGWNAFVVAVRLGLTLLGVLLPWLIVIVPAWLLTAFLLRRRRKGDRSLTPGPGNPEPDPDDAEESREDDEPRTGDGPVPHKRP
ncbi:DUF4349 domain-containing protein [Streptosporangium sp. CA-115845]|uniref:DUF4349 domain-containing protein n=1 Tax=Streptosporangium sp. CA-115845 TaxID=3240071 RepID=UPI003D913764